MNATAAKPKLGDQRYLAVWCNTKSLEAEALKNGWLRDATNKHGPLDYVEANDHEVYRVAPNFTAAVDLAYSKLADDFWGCPRVYLQEYGPDDVPAGAREWEDVKFWDIEKDGSPVEQSV